VQEDFAASPGTTTSEGVGYVCEDGADAPGDFDPNIPDDGDGNGGGGQQNGVPECFPNSTTVYIGFEWWLPVDHANEIQTDSVSFDLGFYTEQCRHNDGVANRS
jgi:hypothetical protein